MYAAKVQQVQEDKMVLSRTVKIVTGVPEAIPVIGSPLVELLRGSASVE